MSDIKELMDKCTRMSILLGMVTGVLIEVVRDDRLPNILKQPLFELLTRVTNGVDELYYNKDAEHE